MLNLERMRKKERIIIMKTLLLTKLSEFIIAILCIVWPSPAVAQLDKELLKELSYYEVHNCTDIFLFQPVRWCDTKTLLQMTAICTTNEIVFYNKQLVALLLPYNFALHLSIIVIAYSISFEIRKQLQSKAHENVILLQL